MYNATTGCASNVVICNDAGKNFTTNVTENTLIGNFAGRYMTTGLSNTCLGNWSGSYVTQLTTGSQNVLLGSYSRVTSSSSTKEHVVGYNHAGSGSNTFSAQGSSGVFNENNTSSWNTTSDERIKKNIVDNNTGLDVLNQIQVRNFEYRTEDEIVDFDLPSAVAVKKEGTQLGVIAQEIEKILPETVKTQTTGVKTVDPNSLTWYLINAVKELSAKVKALEGK